MAMDRIKTTVGHTITNEITKTVLFPVPTEYCGDEQDDTEVGIATYVGPRYLRTRWQLPDENGIIEQPGSHGVWDWDDPSGFMPCPIDCVEVKLDAEAEPLHALNLWGQNDDPDRFDVVCGDPTAPDPNIMDPLCFTEAIDPQSLYYDVVNSRWTSPSFRSDAVDAQCAPGETQQYSWATVRATRDAMLANSDSKINDDMPPAVKQPWLDYRAKLRNIPADWAGIGTSTYLITWPIAPDEKGGALNP